MIDAYEFLRDLRARGIEARAEGDELKVTAPKGAMTAELAAQIRAHKAALLDFLRAPTLAERGAVALPSASDTGPPLFLLCGIGIYAPLSKQLPMPCFGVFLPDEEEAFARATDHMATVEGLARGYVRAIREQHPHGPYRLGGLSFGGVLAMAAANQLEQEGEEVDALLLLDAILPSGLRRDPKRWLARGLQRLRDGDVVGRIRRASNTFLQEVLGADEPDEDESIESYDIRAQSYRRALREHTPERFPGRAMVVQTTELVAEFEDHGYIVDPHWGFTPYVGGPITRCEIPSGHVEMLQVDAHVDTLSAQVRSWLGV